MADMTAEPFPPADDVDAPLTEAEMRAFVGRRADYYVDRWTRSGGMGANWAAFWLVGFWLPYRKMYRATFILFAAIIADSVVEEVLNLPNQVSRGAAIAAAVICCSWANLWYFKHASAKIRALRTRELAEDEHLNAVAAAGGTSLLAGIGLLVGAIVVTIASVIVSDTLLGRAN
jgi:Protein of unknown function (DUF2628)